MDDEGIVRIARWVYEYDMDDSEITSVLAHNVPNWFKIPIDTRKSLVDIGMATSEVDYIRQTAKALPTHEIDRRAVEYEERPSFVSRVKGFIRNIFKRGS